MFLLDTLKIAELFIYKIITVINPIKKMIAVSDPCRNFNTGSAQNTNSLELRPVLYRSTQRLFVPEFREVLITAGVGKIITTVKIITRFFLNFVKWELLIPRNTSNMKSTVPSSSNTYMGTILLTLTRINGILKQSNTNIKYCVFMYRVDLSLIFDNATITEAVKKICSRSDTCDIIG